MDKLLRPFEFLKLIRDGILTEVNYRHLRGTGSLTVHFFERLAIDLEKIGLIRLSKKRKFQPTPLLKKFLKAMNISLAQLTAYTHQSVVCNPLFGLPHTPAVKSDIFVVMPFLPELKPVYEDHIKSVVGSLNLSIARGDDFFTAKSIISDIWSAIYAARIIVADCTGRNPNVFYEIGIAHSLGKPVILIAQSVTDIPFDVSHVRTIIYSFTSRGMKRFEKSLRATIESELRGPQSLEEIIERRGVGWTRVYSHEDER